MTFLEKLDGRWRPGYAVCVSLDVDDRALDPSSKLGVEAQLFFYCCKVVDAVVPIIGAFKLNPSFFWSYGLPGLSAMTLVINYIRETYPDIPLILDAKWADVGHTAEAQAAASFDSFGCDAVTAVPYGEEAGYMNLMNSGFVFLCVTMGKANDSSMTKQVQSREVHGSFGGPYRPVWRYVLDTAVGLFGEGKPCGAVVTAHLPDSVQIGANMNAATLPLLIPGVGAQGADLSHTLFRLDSRRSLGRFLVVGGRSIMFAGNGSSFADDARRQVFRMNEIIHSFRTS